MSIFNSLVFSAIEKEDYSILFQAKDEYAISRQEKDILTFVRTYIRDSGKLPTAPVVTSEFGELPFTDGEPPYFLQKLRDRYIYTSLAESLPSMVKGLKSKPKDTLKDLKTLVSGLSSDTQSVDSFWHEGMLDRVDAYTKRIGTDGVTYLGTGNSELDKLTFGFKETDLWTFGARSGVGKCLGKGTEIRMYDLSIKKVEDVIVGDKLLGPDGSPRRVLSLARGREQMYWVRQKKGDDYRVNESHILSLKCRRRNTLGGSYAKRDEVVNISVADYANKSAKWKSFHKGWKAPLMDFTTKYPANKIDPYFLGIWLGDGSRRNATITTTDKEVIDLIYETAKSYSLKVCKNGISYSISSFTPIKGSNPLINELREYGLLNEPRHNDFGEKHIPPSYLRADVETRLQLLAGILDSDGYLSNGSFEITQKRKGLFEDIVTLARSLGFCVTHSIKVVDNTPYCKGFISGHTEVIPNRVPRRMAAPRLINKDPLVTGITLEKDIVDDYYGFTIDGDHLFCLKDFTVTHNTWWICRTAYECEVAIKDDPTHNEILFVTNEMNEEEIGERFDCIKFKLNYKRFLAGELSEREFSRYSKGGKLLHDKGRKIRILFNCTSIDELDAKMHIYRPSIVFVDGSYLMEPKMEEGMVKTTFITRNLKLLAKNHRIPIVNTTQLRKKSGKSRGSALDGQDEFYYGSYIQDSDLAIRGFKTPDMEYSGSMGLDFVKGRRIQPNTMLEWFHNLETMKFSYELAEEIKEKYDADDTLEI